MVQGLAESACTLQLQLWGTELGDQVPLGLFPLQATGIMWYVSTRGMAPRVDFEGALFSGYAPDGGLFMPEELPQLGIETLRQWSSLSYPSLVKELCTLFIGPELIPRDVLNGEHPQPPYSPTSFPCQSSPHQSCKSIP